MSLDKSRPFVHEKYRKLVRKKDLKNEAHGKNVTKVFFVRWITNYLGVASNRDFFNTLTTYDGQMKGGKCTQYYYIHGTHILKQIDQCKKGLRLERWSRVSINTFGGKK